MWDKFTITMNSMVHSKHPLPILFLVFFLQFLIHPVHLKAQELRNAAQSKGIKFGSFLSHLYDGNHIQLFQNNISTAQVPAFWGYTEPSQNYFPYTDFDNAVNLGEQNGWELWERLWCGAMTNIFSTGLKVNPCGRLKILCAITLTE